MKPKTFKKIVFSILATTLMFTFLAAFSNNVQATPITTTRTFSSLSYDGWLYNSSGSYGVARNATGSTIYDSSTTFEVGQGKELTTYAVKRGFLYFDSSSIPDNATVTGAVLSLYIHTNSSDTDFNVTIQNGQPTYPHIPLQAGDYYYIHYSGDGGSRNTTTITSLDYWNITFSATGLGWINLQGTTKLCLRSSRDINNNASTGNEHIGLYSYEAGESKAPTLYVAYEYDGYLYILHGAYDEEGLRDGAINVTCFKATEAPETVELDGTENVTSETIPINFKFTLGTNESRTYYLRTTFEEIYVFKPADPYFTYYVTVYDFVGLTDAYLESLINVNGTDRVVERWKLTKLTDIPFTFTWGNSYKFRLIANEGTFTYDSVVAGADYYFELAATSQQFPTDYTSFGMNVSISATRQNATWIQVLYLDSSNETAWLYVAIKTKYGTVVYSTNNTGNSQTVNWYSAENITNYIATATIQHNDLGTLYYSKALASPIVGTSPFDFSFLGDSPIDLRQIFGFFICLLFGGLASTKNAYVGLGLTVVVAAILTVLGWLVIEQSVLVIGIALAFLLAFSYLKRREA